MKQVTRMGSAAVLLWASAAASSAAEPVSLTMKKVAGREAIALRNYRVRLVITPARGGAITSYVDALAPTEIVLAKEYNGLCMDHFQGHGWPGEFLEAPYELKIVKRSPDEARVLVWRKANNGILLEKTYTLRADSPAIVCEVKLTAPPTQSRTVAYWLQNVCYAGGDYDPGTDRVFRPSVRGVRSTGDTHNGHYGKEEWLRDFSDGWMALVDIRKKTGLALLADYNDLSISYSCGGNRTFEPMFNMVYLPKGKTSRAHVVSLVPVVGMSKIMTVKPQMVVGYAIMTDNAGGGRIDFAVARSVEAAKTVTFDVAIVGAAAPSRPGVKAGTVTFGPLTDTPQTRSLRFTGAPHDPVVVRVTATGRTTLGKEFTATFEDFFAGAYQWADNITTDMRTPLYVAKRPKQKLRLVKPAKLKVKRNLHPKYLFLYGLLDEEYQVADVLRMVAYYVPRPDVCYYGYSSSYYGNLSHFPYDYDTLLNYDCIILGGISHSGLKPMGVAMLHDYLVGGGSLIVLGSYGAYGRSHLKGTKLGDAFPIAFSGTPFDMEATGGKRVTVGPDTAVFLRNVSLDKTATCYLLHRATPKPGAKVLMQVDGKPFMVVGEYGPNKARIICILGAPMGEPGKGQIPFWQDDAWPLVLHNAVVWAGPWLPVRGFK